MLGRANGGARPAYAALAFASQRRRGRSVGRFGRRELRAWETTCLERRVPQKAFTLRTRPVRMEVSCLFVATRHDATRHFIGGCRRGEPGLQIADRSADCRIPASTLNKGVSQTSAGKPFLAKRKLALFVPERN